MSTIAHGYNTIKLSDDTSLELVICSEQTDEKNIRNTSWNDVYFNSNDETYATIDISVFNRSTGNIEFVKNGACPTFIKSKNKVEVIKAISLPAGIVDKIDLVVYDKDLKGGEIVVMCSDGILESNQELENKELWVKDMLENIETDDVQKIADIVLQEAIDNDYGIPKDDMTVLVAKIEKI